MKRSEPVVEQLIGALIPQPLPRPSPVPPPLPTLPPPRASSGADGIELDLARLDRAGRCSARTLLRRLGWNSEHRFGVDVIDGMILIQRHPRGRLLVDTRGTLTLSAAPRRLCGISSGDQIALARTTGNDVVLDALLLRLHTETACRRGGAGRWTPTPSWSSTRTPPARRSGTGSVPDRSVRTTRSRPAPTTSSSS